MIFFADTPQKVDNIFQSIKHYVLHILAFSCIYSVQLFCLQIAVNAIIFLPKQPHFQALLTTEPAVAQWSEHPNQNLEGCEFDSHLDLELRIFSELPSVRNLPLPNYIVQPWSFTLLDS